MSDPLRREEIPIGTVVTIHTDPPITRDLLARYATASADNNPIHVDIDYAKAAGYPDVFAHGMLIMARLARLPHMLATDGNRLRNLSARFLGITRVGDVITHSATLTAYRAGATGREAVLELLARDQAGELKVKGEAVIGL